MARPLRTEFPDAIYRVIFRGDRREPVFEEDEGGHRFLTIENEAERFAIPASPLRVSLRPPTSLIPMQ